MVARCMRSFWQDETGATIVEYALIASLIAGAIAGVVAILGQKVGLSYGSVMGGFN